MTQGNVPNQLMCRPLSNFCICDEQVQNDNFDAAFYINAALEDKDI